MCGAGLSFRIVIKKVLDKCITRIQTWDQVNVPHWYKFGVNMSHEFKFEVFDITKKSWGKCVAVGMFWGFLWLLPSELGCLFCPAVEQESE